MNIYQVKIRKTEISGISRFDKIWVISEDIRKVCAAYPHAFKIKILQRDAVVIPNKQQSYGN